MSESLGLTRPQKPTADVVRAVEVLPPANLPGEPPTPGDLENLRKSFISERAAGRAGIRRVSSLQGRDLVGQKGSRDFAGLVFPNVWPGENSPREMRLRRDWPELEYDGTSGQSKPKNRYLSPPGRGNLLYLPHGTPSEWLSDTAIPAFITEGEKKALALDELFEMKLLKALAIGLPGVWSFRGTIGKDTGPNGERLDVKGVIPDVERIAWTDRTVVVVYDANVKSNPSVRAARLHLSLELKRRGAKVGWVDLPDRPGVNGVDDLLALDGPEPVLALLGQARQFEERLRVGRYQATPAGLQLVTKKQESEEVQSLTNFNALIVGQIVMDDGVEQTRHYRVEAQIRGRRFVFEVAATDFDSLKWVSDKLPAEAIIYPGRANKDHVVTAIRQLSGDIPETTTYTHTGWRQAGGSWMYLHKNGAVGPGGSVPGVSVMLPRSLKMYELPEPPTGPELVYAVRASLICWELAPDAISIPLHAAAYRAPLGGSDVSIFLTGHTGRGKSELAARSQQHYGQKMDRKNLPANWSSTANALESLAHSAKDALLVVDDFVPQGNSHDVARAHKEADRLLRGQGNQSGRQRMRADGTDSPGRHPRGIIMNTGEDVPRGQSLAARMMIVSVGPNDVNWERLTQAQHDGEDGLYAASMAGYLRYCAPRYDAIRRELPGLIERLRKDAAHGTAHKHTPENIANLGAGLHHFLAFALDAGAISANEQKALWNRGWQALLAAGCAQKIHQVANDPSEQFVSFTRMALTSGHAHMGAVEGEVPPSPAAWGWREDRGQWLSKGDLVGWVDGDDIYVQPESAYRVSHIMARDSNASFALTETALWKRLKEKNLLATTDEKRQTYKVRKKIKGSVQNVLHMRASTIRPSDDEEPDSAVGHPTTPPTPGTADMKGFESEMSVMSDSLLNLSPSFQEEMFG
jgi:Domain of unknown function (DUF3854)